LQKKYFFGSGIVLTAQIFLPKIFSQRNECALGANFEGGGTPGGNWKQVPMVIVNRKSDISAALDVFTTEKSLL